ncbi:hypothetical protein DFA_05091 [Cavenderia fasciculata]|uniref:O-methyltransferase domain-containing protein n=1 Tax=Cavenderia fasciculata TaxID=261658 RepID=F4PNA8_CACFS|nr:uncharacterized protein DFA_05091 [Cavenderia fasciculata]EGG22961.1 hypothetical protein DFA_05091 [Cavenderia fasciculata]|eukprot:XP_004360812.1 hypothetical protein DFA_05091 [Cavenderia fasciculata]
MQEIRSLIDGYCTTKCILVAVEIGLANLIEKNEKCDIATLAQRCRIDRNILYRFMRALTYLGFFHEDEVVDGLFSHTTLSFALCDPNVSSMVKCRASNGQYRSWDTLSETIKTGHSDHTESLGYPTYWEYLEDPKNLQENMDFSQTMSNITKNVCPFLIDMYDFKNFETIVDVGGSEGRVNQKLQHTMVEDKRFECVAGDFFKKVPIADCYILKNMNAITFGFIEKGSSSNLVSRTLYRHSIYREEECGPSDDICVV